MKTASPEIDPVPAAPGDLVATAGDQAFSLSWNASGGAAYYQVCWGTGAAPCQDGSRTEVTDTSAQITGLSNGTSYRAAVIAGNATGASAPSSTVTVTPRGPVPAAPEGLAATAGDGTIALTWSASTGAAYYQVCWGTGAAPCQDGSREQVTETHAQIGALSNGTTYQVAVIAGNGTGESAPSATVSATPLAPLPAAPEAVTAAAGDGAISLTWAPSHHAEYYQVCWGTGTDPCQDGSRQQATETVAQIGGLDNGTAYRAAVIAGNATGESAPSAVVTATPQPGLPGVPEGLAAVAGDGSIALTWEATAGADYYRVCWGTGSQPCEDGETREVDGISTELDGLTNGSTYQLAVRAGNRAGEGGPSPRVSATPLPPAPPSPAGLSASALDGAVHLTWEAVTAADGYRLHYAAGSDPLAGSSETVTDPALTVNGLSNGTSYAFAVLALNSAFGLESEASGTMTATPKVLQGDSGELRFNLDWDGRDDLDLWVEDPCGTRIDYQNEANTCQGFTGRLDVDANAGAAFTADPQENITWSEGAPNGTLTVGVHLFEDRESGSTRYTLRAFLGDRVEVITGRLDGDGDLDLQTFSFP